MPELPGILRRLLRSREPKVLLDSLKLLLPFVEAPVAKSHQEQGVAEQTLILIMAERERRRREQLAASAATEPHLDPSTADASRQTME